MKAIIFIIKGIIIFTLVGSLVWAFMGTFE